MLDIQYIRQEPEKTSQAFVKRGCKISVNDILKSDEEYRKARTQSEKIRADLNESSKSISKVPASERPQAISRAQKLKEQLKQSEQHLELTEAKFKNLMYKLPNLPFEDVPVGKDEKANKVLRKVGKKPAFSFQARDYLTLSEKNDWVDMSRGARTSGSRFGYIKGDLVKLQFALVHLVLDRLTDENWLTEVAEKAKIEVPAKVFIPVVPPVMITHEAFRAMGKLDPGEEEERYYIPKDKLFLVGSAEHSIGPLHMNETLDAEELPTRYIAYSSCFRRESGSYGRDTKGILRVHQFDKLEMFSFTHPEKSRLEHQFFLAIQEALVQELNLPYRVIHISTGDMVKTDAEQFDIEMWLPGQNNGKGEYRETHSTSNSTDFQARRLNAKFRAGTNKEFLHTVNGTAFAIPRTLIAIIENFQKKDGGFKVPKALQ
ncbi:MAG: serine--tRNA ligase [bacterium]|nr:serine--tRNA ligase [bacterium]